MLQIKQQINYSNKGHFYRKYLRAIPEFAFIRRIEFSILVI